MKILVKGKNIEISDSLREYAEKKVTKVGKFFTTSPLAAQITMGTERGMHVVDVTVQLKDLLLRGEEKTNDMYASIDGAIEKIERQILKFKTRINRRLRSENEVVAASVPGIEEMLDEPHVVKTKRFAVKPMSVDEAIMQMDLLGHDFYVFSNAETEEVNVVYRRKDGNYGLIEPEF
ncbi:MAG: ribosome hibernation-promoting factor, HPF/YfiA family [Bacteroidota bacterium]